MNRLVLAKEILGLASGLLLVIPWFRQYGSLLRIRELKTISTTMAFRDKLLTRRQDSLNQPKALDLVLTMVGLLCLTASFALAVLISATESAR
jgi:hypothetical protein